MNKHKTTCKLCNNPLCMEIEIMRLIERKTFTEIEDFCKDNQFNISDSSIKRHFSEHVNEQREVQVRYMYKKQQDKEFNRQNDEVTVKLKELDNIDAAIKESTDLMKAASIEIKRQLSIKIPVIINEKDEAGKATGHKIRYDKVNVSHSVVQLFKGAAEEIRQSAKTKMEILGIDKRSKSKEEEAENTLVDAIMRLDEE